MGRNKEAYDQLKASLREQGGLTTTADAQVLDSAGRIIPGLYAAGATASNIAKDSAGYASGFMIGESSYFGRRAGAHAARA